MGIETRDRASEQERKRERERKLERREKERKRKNVGGKDGRREREGG